MHEALVWFLAQGEERGRKEERKEGGKVGKQEKKKNQPSSPELFYPPQDRYLS